MEAENPELRLADDFVIQTGCNIYLTGRAGTGKTTFLHRLKEKSAKRMIITAPTGVAAINAGGVTLHSFFQLPFGPYVPGYEFSDQDRQRRFNKEKINIIKSLDLLVIDEISMVRADLLDGVDAVLRRYRRGDQPFGGVQLLMIGDLHQLPPVVKNEDLAVLRDHYPSLYFFNSQALKRTELVVIELRHIYRQSDSEFIRLLNRVRENRLDSADLNALNARCIPHFSPLENQHVITLCTHNQRADSINRDRLQKLKGQTHSFKAEVSGDFPEYSFPTSGRLDLKKDAQVMFVRNDPGPDKSYYNGKIGKISRISQSAVSVRCPGDKDDIVVEPISWENIRYTLDKETQEISKNKIGEFIQYPLKPAWAITIHKSQGLTFERAIIDAGAAFAHGQVYVALSRCKTLDGMVLSTPITHDAVKTDPLIGDFGRRAHENQPTREKLAQARITFQQRLLLQCFDCRQLRFFLQRFVGLIFGSGSLLQVAGGDIRSIEQQTQTELCGVGENFIRQLQGLLTETTLPESDPAVLERVTKASVYFAEKLAALAHGIDGLRLESDNKELQKRITKSREQLRKEIEIRRAAALSCREGFSPARYLHGIATADIDFKPVKDQKSTAVTYTKDDVEHPEFFRLLKDWRTKKAAKEGLPHYRIMHQRILIQIAVTLPDTRDDLLKIAGIGPRTLEKYGAELLAMVSGYRQEHGIKQMHLPQPKPVSQEQPK